MTKSFIISGSDNGFFISQIPSLEIAAISLSIPLPLDALIGIPAGLALGRVLGHLSKYLLLPLRQLN